MGCSSVSSSYSKKKILIEAKQLNQWISIHKPIKIFCSSFPLPTNLPIRKEIFLKERIPGAHFFDLVELADKEEPNHPIMMLRNTVKFQEVMKKYDLRFNDTIVLYDNYGIAGALKAWYILQAYGKKSNVYVLNGGFNKWKTNQFAIEESEYKEPIPIDGKRFDTFQYNMGYDISQIYIKSLLENNLKTRDNKQVQLIDARPEKLYKEGDATGQLFKYIVLIQFQLKIKSKDILKELQVFHEKVYLLKILLSKMIQILNKYLVNLFQILYFKLKIKFI